MATAGPLPTTSGRGPFQSRIAEGILDAAAALFAERGPTASMGDIAEAAGISRSTLYRYFENREALLAALYSAALTETIDRIREARLDTVSVEEGIARLARALVAVGNRYLVLVGEGLTLHNPALELEKNTEDPIEELFARGQREGLLRDDLPTTWLVIQFTFTVLSGLRVPAPQCSGVEGTAAAVVSVFLNGAREPGAVPKS